MGFARRHRKTHTEYYNYEEEKLSKLQTPNPDHHVEKAPDFSTLVGACARYELPLFWIRGKPAFPADSRGRVKFHSWSLGKKNVEISCHPHDGRLPKIRQCTTQTPVTTFFSKGLFISYRDKSPFALLMR